MIILSKTHFFDIQRYSKDAYPYECCGALIGNIEDNKKIVKKTVSLDNVSDENKRKRFSITDSDYSYVEKIAHENNLVLLGFYHSHPDHVAEPSETDLKFAWPFFSYIIQSVYDAVPRECRSYILSGEVFQFIEEELKILSD